ncbi:hypothetical protein [Geobacter sp.]|uniref:hypothetical protein n=1 Tax=Geobacter sp. TaxID=46610 RepID=UPI002629AB20|nr:hypothetical protein [Geobacter sp.]
MKKRWIVIVTLAATALFAAFAYGYWTPGDLAKYPECLTCGASRKACAHTRMVAEYVDGTKRAECGLHCLMVDFVDQPGRQPKRVLAADYHDKRLAEAEKSWWVRYDNGVECMGSKAMLAFRTERGADDFIASFGGMKLSYDEALRLTYRDIEAARRKGMADSK